MVENLGCEIMKWPVKWEKRTSKSHPIKVDWFSHPAFTGKIGSLFVQVNANQCLGLVDGIETLKQILGHTKMGTYTVISLIDEKK